MRLAVEHEATLVDVTIEVDRQLRDTSDRLGDVDQFHRPVGEDETPGDAEIPVEPAVEEHTAVDLHPQLSPPG